MIVGIFRAPDCLPDCPGQVDGNCLCGIMRLADALGLERTFDTDGKGKYWLSNGAGPFTMSGEKVQS